MVRSERQMCKVVRLLALAMMSALMMTDISTYHFLGEGYSLKVEISPCNHCSYNSPFLNFLMIQTKGAMGAPSPPLLSRGTDNSGALLTLGQLWGFR